MTDQPMDLVLQDLLAQRAWIEGLCRTLVRDPSDAADIAQETWLSALRRRAPLRQPRAWLRRVVENHARQRRRARTRAAVREHAAGIAGATAADDAAEVNAAFEVQRTVAAAVHGLGEPFRTTVLLHHFEGLTLAAIARRHGEPEGTVRWRLFRAHELLRVRLQDTYGRDWKQALLPLCEIAMRRSGLAAVAAVGLALLGGTVCLMLVGADAASPATARSATAGSTRIATADGPATPAQRTVV